MLGIRELLAGRGLNLSSRIKLVRHRDDRCDMDDLVRLGFFELYQSYQSKPVFSECDYIVSFIGQTGSHARLVGVFRVIRTVPGGERPLPPDFPFPWFAAPDGWFYELERLCAFDDLASRVVIDWGGAALSWHQWLVDKDKEVVEVLPTGYVREFPGYLDFVVSFDELKGIISNPMANREWHRMLAAVAGIYLIVDNKTGKQYVGSACGEEGILGRWRGYAASGHGGNAQLMELLAQDEGYARYFSFTILRTLPRTMTRKEVIDHETLFKHKLGSRAFGLNSN